MGRVYFGIVSSKDAVNAISPTPKESVPTKNVPILLSIIHVVFQITRTIPTYLARN